MPKPRPVDDHARAVHAAHPAIDLHADTLMWSRWVDYDLTVRHEAPLPRSAFAGHVDVPRLQEGGVGAQFFGLVSLPVLGRTRGLFGAIQGQIDELDRAIAKRPSALTKVRYAGELEEANRTGKVAALLGVEGAHALEGDASRLDILAARGVRYLGLLHFSANECGFPAYGKGRRDDDGLTRFGHELVRRAEGLDVLVDLAHINQRGFLDACEAAAKPVIVSHTGVLGAFEHWRNIDDDQLRAVAKTGGVVGVIFAPRYLGGDGLEPVIKHLKHILDVCGEDTPALGSDWDGMIVPTKGLGDPTGLPRLTEAMLAAGISESAVGKILRGNTLRVLRP